METKESNAGSKAFSAIKVKMLNNDIEVRDIINTLLIAIAFLFYTLTFFVPKFYGLTEDYVGVFIFLILAVMTIVNINPFKKIKEKDIDFIALCVLAVLTGVNIIVVKSGFGCFFITVNFAMIWYLSGVVRFRKWQVYLVSGMYVVMLLYWFMFVYTWMFADYTSFAMNTNTAATFTVFSMLCAFIFFDCLYQKHRLLAGLFMTIALVKCFQIGMYHRSRGAFIMLIMFFLFKFIVPEKWWEKKVFFTIMCLIATFGSLLFVSFYIWLGTTGVNFQMPFFYKNIFSGREAIWLEFWELFKAKPLTGIGTNVTITSFFEFNVHNAMYNILVIHGIFVFGLTLFIMYRRLYANHKNISAYPVALAAMVAVFAVCVESFFDVDLIWANYSVNVLFLLLTLNNRDSFSDKNQSSLEESDGEE